MRVNILREETDKTETIVPGLHVPMERRADTVDVDIFPVPHRESSTVRVGTLRAASTPLVIQGVEAPTYPHSGADFVLVSNSTATVGEAKYRYNAFQSSYIHALTDRANVVAVYYLSLLSSTEFTPPNVSLRGDAFEPLADYEEYAVDNWDGYDALPITAETLNAARSILKLLPKTFGDAACSPGADGSIVFEWLKEYGPFRKLFIDIGPGKTWKAYWRLTSGKTGAIQRKAVTIGTIGELQRLFETLLHG